MWSAAQKERKNWHLYLSQREKLSEIKPPLVSIYFVIYKTIWNTTEDRNRQMTFVEAGPGLKVRKIQNVNMKSSLNFSNFFVHILGTATASYFHSEIS